MSASLVGSEMCIRDSIQRTTRALVAAVPALVGLPSAAGGRVRHSTGAPVSYTHLTLPTICSV
eukprot:15396332-Alexandrium_andersonii.AAC.1